MNKVMHAINYYVATGLLTGLSPVAPGTVGSLLGLALVFFLFPQNALLQLAFVALLTIIAVYTAHWLAEAEGKPDPSKIVIDEIAGQAVVFLWVPQPLDLKMLLVGFLLFRIFDIWKPWPIRKLEKLPGGFGIVMDDVAAGIFANILIQVWLRFF